jgi:hypothetical protein
MAFTYVFAKQLAIRSRCVAFSSIPLDYFGNYKRCILKRSLKTTIIKQPLLSGQSESCRSKRLYYRLL